MSQLPVYLDNHSTTPLDPRVLDAMMPFLTTDFGNPAIKHYSYGWRAHDAIETARLEVAQLINAHPSEILFTSGATESNHLALNFSPFIKGGRGILTSISEHPSIIGPIRTLEKQGHPVTWTSPKPNGITAFSTIPPNTGLISIMLAHHELGTINPVREIGQLAQNHASLFHCDATQGVGKTPFDVRAANVDFASLSAHKIYGPKGVGALFVRRSLIDQFNRPGTPNVAGIVGIGKACELMRIEGPEETQRIAALRNELRECLREEIPGLLIYGCMKNRLPGNLFFSVPGKDTRAFIEAISSQIAVSSAAACLGQSRSSIYNFLNIPDNAAVIRLCLGRFNTRQDIHRAVLSIMQSCDRSGKCESNH